MERSPSEEVRDHFERIIAGDMTHFVGELKTVCAQIERGDFDGAVWRLVDIAGQLAEGEAKGGGRVHGWTEPTGRGYQVVKKEPR
jgi:hypothetical protein